MPRDEKQAVLLEKGGDMMYAMGVLIVVLLLMYVLTRRMLFYKGRYKSAYTAWKAEEARRKNERRD